MITSQVNNYIPENTTDVIPYPCYSITQIARFMRPTWGPPGADRTQVGPMLAPWSLLSGQLICVSSPGLPASIPYWHRTSPFPLFWRQTLHHHRNDLTDRLFNVWVKSTFVWNVAFMTSSISLCFEIINRLYIPFAKYWQTELHNIRRMTCKWLHKFCFETRFKFIHVYCML